MLWFARESCCLLCPRKRHCFSKGPLRCWGCCPFRISLHLLSEVCGLPNVPTAQSLSRIPASFHLFSDSDSSVPSGTVVACGHSRNVFLLLPSDFHSCPNAATLSAVIQWLVAVVVWNWSLNIGNVTVLSNNGDFTFGPLINIFGRFSCSSQRRVFTASTAVLIVSSCDVWVFYASNLNIPVSCFSSCAFLTTTPLTFVTSHAVPIPSGVAAVAGLRFAKLFMLRFSRTDSVLWRPDLGLYVTIPVCLYFRYPNFFSFAFHYYYF